MLTACQQRVSKRYLARQWRNGGTMVESCEILSILEVVRMNQVYGNTGWNSAGITSHSLPLTWRTQGGKEFAEAGTGFSYFLPLSRIHPRSIACILDAHTLYPKRMREQAPNRFYNEDRATRTRAHTRVPSSWYMRVRSRGKRTRVTERTRRGADGICEHRDDSRKLQSSPSIAREAKRVKERRTGWDR